MVRPLPAPAGSVGGVRRTPHRGTGPGRRELAVRWELAGDDPVRMQVLAAALRDLPDLPISNRARNATGPGSPLYTLARLLLRPGLAEPDAPRRFLVPSRDYLHPPETITGLRA